MNWDSKPINELCTNVVDCINKTAPVEIKPTPYKMIRTPNIRNRLVDLTNVSYVNRRTFENWTIRLVPRRHDVLLTREAPLGEVAILRSDESVFLGQRIMHYRPNPELIDPFFLAYYLQSPSGQASIKGNVTAGTTVSHIRVGDAETLPIPVPPLEIQRKIGQLLSKYDELIENNNRRMSLLEESINQLYREWFQNLRFPGYENLELLNGIPKNWKRSSIEEVIDFNPKTKIDKFSKKPYLSMKSLSPNSMSISKIEYRIPKGGAKFRNEDTLLARITPCLENGKTGYVQLLKSEDRAASGSTEFIVMRAKTVPSTWVYAVARSSTFRQHAINGMTGSDGRQRTQVSFLKQFELLIPSKDILDKWSNITTDKFEQIKILGEQNQILHEAVEKLMPRLIDGRLKS